MPTSISAKIPTAILILPLLLLMACASTQEQMYALDKSFNAYERALRWQEVDVLVAFHKNEHENLTTEKRKYLKQFRVTSYNVVFSNVEVDGNHANQVIELKYYKKDTITIHELTINNKWEYDEKAQRWYLTNNLPDFK